MSRKTARRMLAHHWDKLELEEARYAYWLGDYHKASGLLFPLVRRLVIEPKIGTKEYEDGERKQASPQREQQKEAETDHQRKQSFYDELFGDSEGPIAEPERDEAGYIVGDRGAKILTFPSEDNLDNDGHPIH